MLVAVLISVARVRADDGQPRDAEHAAADEQHERHRQADVFPPGLQVTYLRVEHGQPRRSEVGGRRVTGRRIAVVAGWRSRIR